MTAGVELPDLPRAVRSPSLPIPEIPPPHRLAHPAQADGTLVELASRRVRVELTGLGGVRRVDGDGAPIVGAVALPEATGANLLVGPRAARRECFHPAGGFLESLQLPDSLPGVVIQWRSSGRISGPELDIRLEMELLPPDPGTEDPAPGLLRFHRAPGMLWAALGGRGVLAMVPGADAFPEVWEEGGRYRARWEIRPGGEGAATLLLQSAPPDAPWTRPAALAAIPAHHHRGEAAAWEGEAPGLAVETGVAEIDLGVRWCRSWIRDRLLQIPGGAGAVHPVRVTLPELDLSPSLGTLEPDEPSGSGAGSGGAAWLAVAAACTGDREAGRAALDVLSWEKSATRILGALALARWTAWTGDAAPLARFSETLVDVFGDPAALRGLDAAVVSSVRNEVVAAGEAAEIPGLRDLQDSAPRSGRRLPMAGAPLPVPPLLLRSGREGISPADRLEEALAVREELGEIAKGPAELRRGRGLAAAVRLIHGALGAQPDATFGRLVLSPLLPPHWTAFAARGLRVGGGVVDVEFQRRGPVAHWTLSPREGSVPLMVVFQPWVPFGTVRAVRVDGAAAQVDLRHGRDWTRLGLQLPVDGVRTLVVEGEEVSPPRPSGTPLP